MAPPENFKEPKGGDTGEEELGAHEENWEICSSGDPLLNVTRREVILAFFLKRRRKYPKAQLREIVEDNRECC